MMWLTMNASSSYQPAWNCDWKRRTPPNAGAVARLRARAYGSMKRRLKPTITQRPALRASSVSSSASAAVRTGVFSTKTWTPWRRASAMMGPWLSCPTAMRTASTATASNISRWSVKPAATLKMRRKLATLSGSVSHTLMSSYGAPLVSAGSSTSRICRPSPTAASRIVSLISPSPPLTTCPT